MTFKAILWKHEPRKNGQCSIKIYYNANGVKGYQKTKLAVFPNQWDENKGLVNKSHPLHVQINSMLRSQLLDLEKRALEGENFKETKKAEVIKKSELTVSEFIAQYINEIAQGQHDLASGTVKNYKALKLRLDQFGIHRGTPVRWEDISQDWYGAFWMFLSENFGVTKRGGFAKHIKILKKFMNEAMRRGLHKNIAHEDRNFKVDRSSSPKIYLNEEEVSLMENLDLSSFPHLEMERDRWLLCYYFLMRYQDGQDHMARDRFFKSKGSTYFRYSANKTGIEATIPVKPKAVELLEKYGYKMPKTTNPEANRKIKTVASMAGINTPATENGITAPKCNFVSTHTARRSAATNLAISGVPIDFIAKLGGWKKMETLQKYLLATGLDVARISKGYDFFQ